MKILLHSSKTMKPEVSTVHRLTGPQFIRQGAYLNKALSQMDNAALAKLMEINETLTRSVRERVASWNAGPKGSAAALTFRGDIYSGLSASQWKADDAAFAQEHLLILSGLYGLLRPFDEIKPYRLEMGYKLLLNDGLNLSSYWESQLAHALDPNDSYINLTANEYFKVIKKQLSKSTVISPKFLTISKKTTQPVFVTVHAKIARGAFANWLITNKIDDPNRVAEFSQLNYAYDARLSTMAEPVFVCREFGGLGLSVRLK